jgi:hypothetical protein
VLAALTIGVCVYTLGNISGPHINPAITIALASIGQIALRNASFTCRRVLGGTGESSRPGGGIERAGADRGNRGGEKGRGRRPVV